MFWMSRLLLWVELIAFWFVVGTTAIVAIAFSALIISLAVYAAVPPAGSEDYEQLMPYTDWIAGRTGNSGGLCCSISDCRVVKWRMNGGSYEAFIAKKDDRGFLKFPNGPDAWISVPVDVIKRENNPTGLAIACWSAYRAMDDGFYCFFLPNLS